MRDRVTSGERSARATDCGRGPVPSGPTCSAFPAARRSGVSLRQVVTQHHGGVVKSVVGAVEQGHRAARAGVENGLPPARVGVELFAVSPLKLFPALQPMTEPLAELRRGCDLFHPGVERERFLLHATRPQALHQDSPAISPRGRFVYALDPDHGVGSSPRSRSALDFAEQLLEHVGQDAARREVRGFDRRVDPEHERHRLAPAVSTFDRAASPAGAGAAAAPSARSNRSVPSSPSVCALTPSGNWHGEDAHADQVGAVDPLESPSDHRAHAEQAGALGRPVARAARSVVLSGDHDQRHPLGAVALGRRRRCPCARRRAGAG